MTHAQFELDLLEEKVPDAIITPFKKEIIALVEKIFSSGQSGGSMPFTASAVSQAVKTLCMQEPLYGIEDIEEHWIDRTEESSGEPFYQHSRLSSVFKQGKDGEPYYLDAIVFQGKEEWDTFTSNGSVTDSNGNIITSRQYIKEFPFKPKTFYIDVISHRYDKDKETGELTPNPEGDWWEHDLKDESQLKEVFEYYNKFDK